MKTIKRTMTTMLITLCKLYPGMNSQIYEYANTYETKGRNEGLTGNDLIDYVEQNLYENLLD